MISFAHFLAFYCETPKFFVRVIFTNSYAKCRFVKFYYSFLWNNYRVWGSCLKCANCFFPYFIDAFHWTIKDIAIIVFNCSYEDATTKFLFRITFKSQVNAIIVYVPTSSISISGVGNSRFFVYSKVIIISTIEVKLYLVYEILVTLTFDAIVTHEELCQIREQGIKFRFIQ